MERNALARKYLLNILSRERAVEPLAIDSPNVQRKYETTTVVFVVGLDPSLAIGDYLKLLRRVALKARVLLVGARPARKTLFYLLESGAHGFLDFEEIEAQLLPAIRNLFEGHIWVHADDLARISERGAPPGDGTQDAELHFTPQQAQVIDFVCRGFSNKQIAPELGISQRTVKFHLRNVFLKLGINDRHLISDALVARKWQHSEQLSSRIASEIETTRLSLRASPPPPQPPRPSSVVPRSPEPGGPSAASVFSRSA